MKNESAFESLDALIEDFQARLRRGENPSITDYALQYPDIADEIMEIFPTVKAMEELKDKKEAITLPHSFPGITNLTRLGEYRIVREIGRGGMGIVYEAFQESLHRPVAIKVLPWLSQENETVLKRFEREARIAARLEYPHIVPIYGFGNHEGIYYYVMQYIRGISLGELISFLIGQKPQDIAELFGTIIESKDRLPGQNTLLKGVVNKCLERTREDTQKIEISSTGLPKESGPVPIPSGVGQENRVFKRLYAHLPPDYYKEVALIIAHVVNALHYAHAQNAIHRDIKPSNLILDTQGVVWIADFGLAKELLPETLTATGDLLGTMRYMAPEFFDGKGDARSDIYSLGLTFCELLTLQPVFTERGSKLMHRIIAGQMPMPRKKNQHIPVALEVIVQKAVMTDPKKRYVSGLEMEKDLKFFIEGRVQALAQRTEQLAGKSAVREKRAYSKSFFILALLVLSAFLLFRFWPTSKEQTQKPGPTEAARNQTSPAPSVRQPEEMPILRAVEQSIVSEQPPSTAIKQLPEQEIRQDKKPAAESNRQKIRSENNPLVRLQGQEAPAQAYEDCKGKQPGDIIQHVTREGNVAATCEKTPGGLVARPIRPSGPGLNERSPQDLQRRSGDRRPHRPLDSR